MRHTKENIHFLNDANDKSFKSACNFEEEGSHYFSADYVKANIQLMKGKTYYDISIRVNQLTGEILLKISDGQEMLFQYYTQLLKQVSANNN